MKLYLIILIVIFLLVALSCKDKPETTESFQNNDINVTLRNLKRRMDERLKKEFKKISNMDRNNDEFIEKSELRKNMEDELNKELEKAKEGGDPPMGYSEEKRDEYLDNKTNMMWSFFQGSPQFKGKNKISLKILHDEWKKMNKKNYEAQAKMIRDARKQIEDKKLKKSSEKPKKRMAVRRKKKSSKNNKSFGISCKSQPGEDSFKCVIDKTTGNLAVASEIGKNLTTSNRVPKKVTKADSQKQIAALKKKIENQNKKINNLDSKVTNSTDKFFASVKNRDSKLLEANDGVKPIDPSSFSFKPSIRFKHKEPSRKVASAYGWSFMPPHYWSVPQKRPPACIPSKKNTATVTPIYDKSVPVDVMDYTQVGSILPKFEYNEVHNPNYYYPGWIAKKEEPYPGKNGKPVMKTGEYYNMKLARPTGLEPKDALNFGNKIIDEKIHPQRVIRKRIVRRSFRKAKK